MIGIYLNTGTVRLGKTFSHNAQSFVDAVYKFNGLMWTFSAP